MNQGIIIALFTALLYGSWAVPIKTLKIEPKTQAFWLTLGHLLVAVIIFIFVKESLSFKNIIGPIFAGVLWATGIILGFVGIKHLGITRAIGIWVPTLIIISALWGLIYFGEARNLGPQKLAITIFALLLLILAAILIVSTSKGDKKLGNVKLGIIASLIIGVFHGSFFVPMRMTNLSSSAALLPMSLGLVATTSIVSIFQKLKLNHGLTANSRMLLGGLILGVGNLTALITIQLLGVAQGFPLTQLAIVVNTLWGVFVFKEVTSAKGKIMIAIGIVLALTGAILLNSARA